MSGRITQRVVFPDGVVRYSMEACYRNCTHASKCFYCPHFKEALNKLGQYEDVSDPATELLKEIRKARGIETARGEKS